MNGEASTPSEATGGSIDTGEGSKLEARKKAFTEVMNALKDLDPSQAQMVINSAQVLIFGRVSLPQRAQG